MEAQLGLMRAVIVVWVSGALASALLALFVSPVAWTLIAGSARHIDDRWGVAAALVAVNALLAAVGVTIGVGLLGFRLSYGSAVLALAVGGILAVAVTRFLFAESTSDPTGIAMPALGTALWPLRLLLGLLLPAYLINASASVSHRRWPELPPEPPRPDSRPVPLRHPRSYLLDMARIAAVVFLVAVVVSFNTAEPLGPCGSHASAWPFYVSCLVAGGAGSLGFGSFVSQRAGRAGLTVAAAVVGGLLGAWVAFAAGMLVALSCLS